MLRLALPLLLLASAVTAAPPGQVARFKIGSLEAISLSDGTGSPANDGKTFGVGQTTEAVAAVLRAAGLPGDKVLVALNVLLVRTGKHVALLDTGYGPVTSASGALGDSLRQAGIAAIEVTDILITHTHGDHIGNLVDADGNYAFPAATVRMAATEWAYLQANDTGRAKAIVTAISPHVQTFTPGAEVLPGITAVAVVGHTPGHVGYRVRSGRDSLLDIGDSAHSSVVSLAHPEWLMGFDGDRETMRGSRQALLSALAKTHERMFAPHFPFPGVGRVVKAGSGYAWRPALD